MLKESELKTAIGKGNLCSVYLLFGNDPYLVKRYTNMLAAKAVPTDWDLNFLSFSETASVQDIYDAVSQFSFTGGRICASVSNFNFESCALSEFKKLTSIIPDIPENNVLVLYYDVMSVDPKKSDRFKKLSAVIEENGGTVAELNHKTESELIKMLCDGAARRGSHIEASAAKHLIENCSDDLSILINELEKLTAYSCGEPITNEMIDKVSAKTVEASIYDIAKFILLKKADEALLTLSDLFVQKVDPYVVFSTISSTYVDIYRVKTAVSTGIKAESIGPDFGYSPKLSFKLTNAARTAKMLSDRQLSLILNELLKADYRLKSGMASIVLEELIVKIIKISATGNAV